MSDEGDRNPLDDPDRTGEPAPPDEEGDGEPAFREPAPQSLGANADDPFEEVDVPDIDEEAVWAALDADADGADLADLTDTLEAGAERVEAVVPKNQFCERCEHFSEPPEVACGHEGTEIRELVDVEQFRVVDCPVVASRRSLEKTE